MLSQRIVLDFGDLLSVRVVIGFKWEGGSPGLH